MIQTLSLLGIGVLLWASALAGKVDDVDPAAAKPPLALQQSAYVGQETRDIKSLSAEDIAALASGEGMGLAKVAELNRYPGPRHVLDLADELELSSAQKEQTSELFVTMQGSAVDIGRRLIAAEAELDRMFAGGAIDSAALESQLAVIGDLQARLRFVHLEAHLQQERILSRHQVARYVKLRGYHGDYADHH